MLAAGRLVAFPTETVYGLGANALDAAAVARIFAAKQRPTTDPLIVHLASAGQLDRVAIDIPPVTHALAERFWPGPLTLVLRRGPRRAAKCLRRTRHRRRARAGASGRPRAAGGVRAAHRGAKRQPLQPPQPDDGAARARRPGRARRYCARRWTDDDRAGIDSDRPDADAARAAAPGGADVAALRALLPDLRVPDAPLITSGDGAAAAPGSLLKHYAPRTPLFLLHGDERPLRVLSTRPCAPCMCAGSAPAF
jgi:L-threonylcarbamoyladenylate synthase